MNKLVLLEIKDYGLVNFVVPTDELATETKKLALRLASGPTRALGNIKKLMHAAMESGSESQLQIEA